nr:melanin-concentrating hormone receptor 1 [Pelodiscus sinensis]|eukprot:XP_006123887.2 melanin-concentrating hormone receptor 1 [Pelodiscus sinensis]
MDFKINPTVSLNSCIANITKALQNFSLPGEPSTVSYASFIMPTLFGIIFFLGIVGNSLVICRVFKKSSPRSSVPDIFIISLSMVDLLFLLGMPFLIHQLLGNGAWHFGETMCTMITALDANSQFTSTYILTAMSIDRYLATVYPFTSTRFRKPLVAILVICMLWTLSFLCITPVWLYAQLIPLPGGLLGCGIQLPNPQNDIYWYTLYQFFLVFALPFTLITVAYRRILLRMAKSSEALTGQKGARTCTKKVTRVAIAICLAFFICWAPYHMLQLVQLTMHHPTLSFYYAYNVAISLGYANSCINPFIYILLGQTFRRRPVVSVRPAAAREEASQNDGNSAQGNPSESGHPVLHLVSVSGR